MEIDEKKEANEHAMDMGFFGIPEPSPEDFVSGVFLLQIGSSGRSYRREHQASCRRIVSELFSPFRDAAGLKQMKRRHLLPGFRFLFDSR